MTETSRTGPRTETPRNGINLTIRGVGPSDPIGQIARIAERHPAVRLEAAIRIGRTTHDGGRATPENLCHPSYERLREMISECRTHALGTAVHLEDYYAELTRSGEHRIIAGLTRGVDRIQVEDTGYDYEAMNDLQRLTGLPTTARNWTGFTGVPPSMQLDYLYTDIGQGRDLRDACPAPWPGPRCGYGGASVDADPAAAARAMLAVGNGRGWIEIDRSTITDAAGGIDSPKLDRLLAGAAAAATAPDRDGAPEGAER